MANSPKQHGTERLYGACSVSIEGKIKSVFVLLVQALYSEDQLTSSDAEPTKPRFTQPLQDKAVLEGNRARLDCVIVAHPEPEVCTQQKYIFEDHA